MTTTPNESAAVDAFDLNATKADVIRAVLDASYKEALRAALIKAAAALDDEIVPRNYDVWSRYQDDAPATFSEEVIDRALDWLDSE